eukprot:2663088-Rhodomonas_salina.12
MVQTRMKLVDNMDVMVAQVSAETKRRVEYEASRRPVFVDQAVQTHCGLGDMELLCAINEEPPPDEDPVDTHSRIITSCLLQRRRFQPGVPLAFQVMNQNAGNHRCAQKLSRDGGVRWAEKNRVIAVCDELKGVWWQGCVMDSRAWQAHKQQRLEQQTVKALQVCLCVALAASVLT